jgi:hypothetical protein
MSCPIRRARGLPGTAGGTLNRAYCGTGINDIAACDITSYPSYHNKKGDVVYDNLIHVNYVVDDCETGQHLPNLDLAIEVHPATSSAGHCEGGPPTDPLHAASRAIGRGFVGNTLCDSLPDGGYHCVGNTGSLGTSFVVHHHWPEVATVMNVLLYSTVTGEPFFGATDTVFRFCADQRTALTDQLVDIPDTLFVTENGVSIGAKPWHPINHYVRDGVRPQLEALARNMRIWAKDAYPIHINDAAIGWGGVFDIHRDWKPEHWDHSYGFAADIRTHLNCDPNQPLYDKDKLGLLEYLAGQHFQLVKHYLHPGECAHLHVRYVR